jgi:hypothetical protein
MPGSNGSEPTPAAIDREVHKAFADQGYVQADGSRSMAKFRVALCEQARTAKANNRRERGAKAIQRGELVHRTFPDYPVPDDHASQPNPELARAAWKQLWSLVWTECGTGANGTIQRMIGQHEGNGWVLCRCKVGPDRIDAIYITTSRDLIRDDITRPANSSAEKKALRDARNREMLMLRQPENAEAYMREYVQAMEVALEAGKAMLELTMGTINVADDEKGEDGE